MNIRWRVSQHEAGHLIASWYSGRVLGVPSAFVRRTEAGVVGRVVHEGAFLTNRTPASLWA